MTVFVDTSVWFAAANSNDDGNRSAKAILSGNRDFATSTFVLAETWRLLHHRLHWRAAEEFWRHLRRGAVAIEPVGTGDLDAAWAIGQRFPDQEFSLTDRTSFAVMERLGLRTVASFDRDFAVYRFGRRNAEAFDVLR